MEVNLYASNTINGSCLAVIDALGAKNKPDAKHIFIAPDKFSLSIETNIFRRLNLQAAFNIDVVSFMRLTTKALGRAGGSCLTKEGALLVFKKVLNRNADKLTHYAGVARMPSFAAEMYAVITSFRNNCYTPQDIISAADSFSRATKNKALDIALLYNQYISELSSGYPDATSRTDKFIAEAATLDIIRDSHIYIGGFAAFSAKQYQIIEVLMRYAKSVSIATTPHNGGGNASLYPYFTLERLKDIAQLCGTSVTITPCAQPLQEPFASINKGLFSLSRAAVAPPADKFFIVEEDTVYNEINGIAKEILHLTAQKGLRYKDIAVVCCNDNYRELISSIFMRYGIPCFIDKKYRLKDAAIVRLLFSALDVVEYGFRQDKVLKYIKNPLCGISPDDADMFENYVYENCISYKGFFSPFNGENAAAIEEARQKLIQRLDIFTAKKQPATGFADTCKAFLAANGVIDALISRLDTLADAALQASNLQAVDKLHAILQQVGTLLAEDSFDFGECKNILLSCIEGTEFSLIPQYADSIFVGNIQDSLYDNIKVLFIMSATVEVLPPTHNYRAIISAKDFVQMQDAGLHLYPAPPDLIKEDMFMLLDLFTKASGSIYISYSNVTPLGQPSRPSSVVQELRDITNASTVCLSQKHSVQNIQDVATLSTTLASQDNTFFEFLQMLPKVTYSGDTVSQKLDILYNSLSLDRRKRLDRLLYNKDAPPPPDGAHYFGKDGQGRYTVNATQLEAYFACPYLHHLQKGVRLYPRKDGRLQRNNAGIIIHSVLEQFFRRTKDTIRQLNTQQITQIGEEVIQDVYSDPRIAGGSRNLFTLNSLAIIRKECIRIIVALAQKIKMSAYTPHFLEYSFGSKDEVVLRTQQADFVFRGKADRVDTRQDGDTKKAIVIDYKTGSQKDADNYFGSNMQLWIYLKALAHDGYIGQGAFYLPIKDTVSQKDNPFLLNGYFNIQEIDSLDTDFYSREDGQSLTVNAKLSRGKCKLALTPQEFDALIDYHCAVATLALQELLDGSIIKAPKAGYDCSGCSYYLVCGGALPQDCREVSKKRQTASGEDDDAQVD